MGNFYVNITTRKASAEEILLYLKSKKLIAFLIKGPEDYCTIYEKKCDEQDIRHITSLLKKISSQFKCPAIGMINHDDDILAYDLWSNGKKEDEYVSCPGYFDGDENRMSPEGGNAKLLSDLMGNGKNVDVIEAVLKASGDGDENFVFAIERHEALAKAVGLPTHTVGFGFSHISAGEVPEGIQSENILQSNG